MIYTQRIKSTTDKIKPKPDTIQINVLKWNNSKYKSLCPYYLKTDGEEENYNQGGILFENFYQGSKVYGTVYESTIFPSKYQTKPENIWWKFNPVNPKGDVLIDFDTTDNTKSNEIFNLELYNNWKTQLWACINPIRYSNHIKRRSDTRFALVIDKQGNQKRLNYLEGRKELYVCEFGRLVRKTREYNELLKLLQSGSNLLIAEIDVSSNGKKGEYGKDCDEDNNCLMTLDKINKLLEDTHEAFDHGLVIAKCLLEDLEQTQNVKSNQKTKRKVTRVIGIKTSESNQLIEDIDNINNIDNIDIIDRNNNNEHNEIIQELSKTKKIKKNKSIINKQI